MKAINALMSAHWALSSDVLEKMSKIAQRLLEKDEPLALEKMSSSVAEGTKESLIRDGVGIIPVHGPMFRYANALSHVCQDVTSYQMIARDLHTLCENPDVHTIILDIDSPGGEVNGCLELSGHIKEASKKKKIISYIGGAGCSAAYWIASASSEITASASSEIGSIGAVFGLWKPEQSGKELIFVSSVSPDKNKDPETERGAKLLQSRVDDMGSLFVDNVAKNRGKSREHILENYGQGQVFIAAKALKRGMIDKISDFETLLSEQNKKNKELKMTKDELKAKHPEIYQQIRDEEKASLNIDEIRKEAASGQIDRIKSVLNVGAIVPDYLMSCIDDPKKDEKDAAFALWNEQKNQAAETKKSQIKKEKETKEAGSDYLKKIAKASQEVQISSESVETDQENEEKERKNIIDDVLKYASS